MKLQFIHKKKSAPRASSLYCQWINSGQGEGGGLVAVWMDLEMRAFQSEFECGTRAEGQFAGVAEMTGDEPPYLGDNEAGEIRNEEARQP